MHLSIKPLTPTSLGTGSYFLRVFFLSPSVAEVLCFSLTKKICTGVVVSQSGEAQNGTFYFLQMSHFLQLLQDKR